tara:strand:+ start:83 stop:352 length:270 start_codon:yes stop_codon:yes gene_type:complete
MRMQIEDSAALEGQMWEAAFDLIDKLEDLTGAEVTFVTRNKALCGFQLVSSGRLLMIAEYDESTQNPSDAIDILGGMYLEYISIQSADA